MLDTNPQQLSPGLHSLLGTQSPMLETRVEVHISDLPQSSKVNAGTKMPFLASPTASSEIFAEAGLIPPNDFPGPGCLSAECVECGFNGLAISHPPSLASR